MTDHVIDNVDDRLDFIPTLINIECASNISNANMHILL